MPGSQASSSGVRTAVCTGFALVAFAANSVFCRLALGETAIDPASFTTIRLLSGAVTLVLIAPLFDARGASTRRGKWVPGFMLFLYAIAFSFAYVSLSAGTGALILFGAVQVTMILSALLSGERPRRLEWAGVLVALAGLVVLVFPGLTAPSLAGSGLMAVAGVSWGVYSLLGRGAMDAVFETRVNFVRSLPFVALVSLVTLQDVHLSGVGVALAVLSGAIASGLGYVVWYAALKHLTATRAATVQLSVPVLAAMAGVLFLSEDISARLLLSSLMILGGIALAVARRGRPARDEGAA